MRIFFYLRKIKHKMSIKSNKNVIKNEHKIF